MDGGSARVQITRVGAIEGYQLVKDLLPRHYEEVAKFKDVSLINPDLDRYEAADRNGRFIALVATVGSDVLGYSANFLNTNLHYSDLLFCQNDVLYVVPEARQSRVGLSLIRETVKLARAAGARLMLWHAKEGTPLDALLPRLKYEVLDKIWAARI
jgi:GNAT superfamily N-acetyltransferase